MKSSLKFELSDNYVVHVLAWPIYSYRAPYSLFIFLGTRRTGCLKDEVTRINTQVQSLQLFLILNHTHFV